MGIVSLVSFILVSLGSINWLTVGIFELDMVAAIFGSPTNVFSRITYIVIGVAALWLIIVSIVNRGMINCCCCKDQMNKPKK